jgi:predicted TIM-barrel fold metal-dependent hydrolase
VRFVTEGLTATASAPAVSGWAGIKGAFIPDDDRVLAIRGIPGALDISRGRYLAIQQELFSYAQERDLPLLYHVNLSEHCDWMREVLAAYPRLRICIPHLGYSLRRITDLLERFEHTYTDPSYLIAVLEKNNPRYCAFIRSHSDRILLGSDALIVSNPIEEILSYARYFSRLAMGEDLRQRILRLNARTFLSLPA